MLYNVSCLKKNKKQKQKQNNTTSSTLVKPKRRKKKKEKRKGIVRRTFMPSSQKSKSQIWAILSKPVLPIFLSLFGMILFWWGRRENLWVPPKSLPFSTLKSTKQLQKKKNFTLFFSHLFSILLIIIPIKQSLRLT